MTSKKSWIFILLGTVVMMVVMIVTGEPLKTENAPLGIIDLELATNTHAVNIILNDWDNGDSSLSQSYRDKNHFNMGFPGEERNSISNIIIAKKNTYLDFIFIFFYTSLFFLLCKASVRHLSRNNFDVSMGNFLAKAVIVSALLDVIENTGMLLSLTGNVSTAIAVITSIASFVKWSIVAITILYLLLFAIYLGLTYRRK